MNPNDLLPEFADPPARLRPRPLWFWNGAISQNETRRQVAAAKEVGYSGFSIVATHDMSPTFMSEEYLDAYAFAVDAAAENGSSVCLYDDFWFPTGAAGGALAKEHPEALSKRLDLHATDVSGPTRYSKPVPPGVLMSAVAMNLESTERTDVRSAINDDMFSWHVPEGRWRIMFFTCVTDGAKGLVDYLEPTSVDAFIELTYEKYHRRLADHFGSTIDMAFHDETTFHWVEGGRAWTPKYNEYFEATHGFDPAMLYPALWYRIGPETTTARCLLFGMRTTLFASSFIKRLRDWCNARGLALTGHVDQEEMANPVGLCGDLMKVFEYQDIPAFDEIFYHGRANQIAKVVSSAAVNYGRPLVMCECYGVIENLTVSGLYREAIDLYARGMNVLMPHAMWYKSSPSNYPPDLSPTDADFGPHLHEFNTWAGRVQSVLQRGSHVADIGVLYPIDSLKAGYRFDSGGDPYEGGITNPEADYLALGDMLFSQIRRDFTFVHPDVLDERCVVDADESSNAVLRLNTGRDSHSFRIFVIPGSTAISLSNLRVLKAFHDAGGLVVGTTRLPDRAAGESADRSMVAAANAEVRQSIDDMFGSRGRAVFVSDLDAVALRRILDDAVPVCDVAFTGHAILPTGVSCTHKHIDGLDAYFLANSSDDTVAATLQFRGHHDLQIWDPRSGRAAANAPVRTSKIERSGETVTELSIRLQPVSALFAISN